MTWGKRLSVAKLTPLEWFRTSSSCARSSPALRPATIASAVAARAIALRKLFSTLVVWPDPGSPMWYTALLKVSNTAASAARGAGGPAGQNPGGPPLGAGPTPRNSGFNEFAPLGLRVAVDPRARAGIRGA